MQANSWTLQRQSPTKMLPHRNMPYTTHNHFWSVDMFWRRLSRVSPLWTVFAIALMLATVILACRGGGANPGDEDLVIPVVQPTTSPRICRNDQYPPDAPKFEETANANFTTSSTGVEYYTISDGSGPSPELDWQVSAHYTGWLEDGCIFGSTYLQGREASFFLFGIIPGWREAILDMKVGERRRVRIPPDQAYGSAGSPPRIPVNATLIFDIALIGAITNNDAVATATAVTEAAQTTATAVSEEISATITAVAEQTPQTESETETPEIEP